MKVLQIHPKDNVAVALEEVPAGTSVPLEKSTVTAKEKIPRGHKMALEDIKPGLPVYKYGYPIGTAFMPVLTGEWVHTHNIRTALRETAEYTYEPKNTPLQSKEPDTFMGYLREDGKAGIRNEIWILPTVGCVNDVCTRLAAMYTEAARENGIGGIYAFPHPYGCSQLGDDHEHTRTILARLAKHPNAGGVLIVGLGCENNTMKEFKTLLGNYNHRRVKYMVCQAEADELEAGGQLLQELFFIAAKDSRQAIPLNRLVVGLKCGGSDGLSGITANPVIGAFSDLLISMGGSTILTEVPEMFGAEASLFNRCASKEVFNKAVGMVEAFKAYFNRHGQAVYENPSPGNKDGGITTLEDKSLGCVQKGGNAPVVDVLEYGGSIQKAGLTLMSGPGNDLVSTTALSAAGAQLILFSTGRGSPFGAPAVTLKISSNTQLMENKPNWIDFNAGIITGGESISQAAKWLLQLVQGVASGELSSKAEQNGYRGIAIFKNGVTL